jgi:hypothetical protein
MGKCKLELFLLLMFCTSELDLNNSLFLTTNKKIHTEIGEASFQIFKKSMTEICATGTHNNSYYPF